MRLHRHLCQSVVQACGDIFFEGYYAEKVVERHLKKNKKWGARDRRFFAETVYYITRWWRRLWYTIDEDIQDDEKKLWLILGTSLMSQEIEIPEWEEWKALHQKSYLQKLASRDKDLLERRAVAESVPDWIDEVGEQSIGTDWNELLTSLNEPAQVVLRTNTLLTDRDVLLKKLANEDIPCKIEEKTAEAIVLNERKNVFRTQAFKEGFFEVQDVSSQQVGHFLNVEPGQRVVDACAGAGGKSLHLAALMRNQGQIISLDIHQWKLQELKKRARRAKASNIETRLISNSKVIKRLGESVDRLLLDVPCSGLGVLRRHPDTKWKLKPEDLSNLNKTQSEILSNYSRMLKPGGQMVYSTCSILPSENQQPIQKFLKENSDWGLMEDQTLYPYRDGYDGFYMARLEKR